MDKRHIIHVDMDAFYASVEQREDPRLKGKPVIVGGPSKRGVVSTASYEARLFGVHSAMPVVKAKQLCPQGIFLPGRHALYKEVSQSIFSIFKKFTPLVEGLSLDEAFLDVTGSTKALGSPKTIASKIKEEIFLRENLTASAGVASNKFIAKIASDFDKPNGLTVVPYADNMSFLENLPIEIMWGIGQKTSQKIKDRGILTFGALATCDSSLLTPILGKRTLRIQELARGLDAREIVPSREAKSIGSERTFEHDLKDHASILKAVLSQSTIVSRRLLKEGYAGKSLGIKIKYADFQLVTRQITVSEPVSDSFSIYRRLLPLVKKTSLKNGVRLVGIFVSSLCRNNTNLNLFSDPIDTQRKQTDKAVSAVLDKFGANALTRASLLKLKK